MSACGAGAPGDGFERLQGAGRIDSGLAKECFCGCGRKIPKFPLGIRSINTRGRQVSERLAMVEEEHLHMKGESPEIAAWCEQGETFRELLEGAMHSSVDPRSLDERRIREWQAEGREIKRYIDYCYAQLGKWARERGLTDEEAVAALARGEYPGPGEYPGR